MCELQMNIFMIRVLSMSTRGMKNLQFHSRYDTKSGEEESVLQFTAERVHLGKVVAKSGTVRGSPGKDLTIHGSRVGSLSKYYLYFCLQVSMVECSHCQR